jgi:glycosyltransferase involved in cell wall biosynthesis
MDGKKTFSRVSRKIFNEGNHRSAKRLLRFYHLRNKLERRKNRELLRKARANIKYDLDSEPLISVVVPTYNRGKILADRAVPSVLKQTYKNFELIVVGDHCTDNTEQLIKGFGDHRIRFFNLPERGKYPEDGWARWMVAGSIPRNKGIELASGEWIAPLDDDDEFSEDHLELLLRYAVQNQFEMIYGVVQSETQSGGWVSIGSLPLRCEHICHNSVLYHSQLKFFKYNVESWKFHEADDWNLWRRMKEAGVKIGFVNRVVGRHYRELSNWMV